MARMDWPLRNGRACVQIVLTLQPVGRPLLRMLVADTGAGTSNCVFDLVLDETDCLRCGGLPGAAVTLGGAYVGSFPLYDIAVQLPGLGFAQNLRVVAVPSVPAAFDGIAGLQFLNRFHYGNFGDPGLFGLEA